MDVSEDMLAKGVDHIGLFQLATRLHRTGPGQELYEGLEGWLSARGCDVLRLGVLDGNARGLAFWTRNGFQFTRNRSGTAPSGKAHKASVMFKALKPMTLAAYQARVPRDDARTL